MHGSAAPRARAVRLWKASVAQNSRCRVLLDSVDATQSQRLPESDRPGRGLFPQCDAVLLPMLIISLLFLDAL